MTIYNILRTSKAGRSIDPAIVASFTDRELAEQCAASMNETNDECGAYRFDIIPIATSSGFYRLSEIEWDADDNTDIEELPTEVTIPDGDINPYSDDIEDALSEYLSSVYGFCHKGFRYTRD